MGLFDDDFFDLDGDGHTDPCEALLMSSLLFGDSGKHASKTESSDFDADLLDAADEVGLDPDAYGTEEDLLAALRDEGEDF